jgi:hypothetical protein
MSTRSGATSLKTFGVLRERHGSLASVQPCTATLRLMAGRVPDLPSQRYELGPHHGPGPLGVRAREACRDAPAEGAGCASDLVRAAANGSAEAEVRRWRIWATRGRCDSYHVRRVSRVTVAARAFGHVLRGACALAASVETFPAFGDCGAWHPIARELGKNGKAEPSSFASLPKLGRPFRLCLAGANSRR